LKEFISHEKISIDITGHQEINNMYSLAFMVVEEKDMKGIRDILKPHRGEV